MSAESSKPRGTPSNALKNGLRECRRVNVSPLCASVCLWPASSRHSHMLEKSLGLLSLLLVLINAHRPLIEVSLTGHTHDRAPSARARRGAAARAAIDTTLTRHWGQIIDRLLS